MIRLPSMTFVICSKISPLIVAHYSEYKIFHEKGEQLLEMGSIQEQIFPWV